MKASAGSSRSDPRGFQEISTDADRTGSGCALTAGSDEMIHKESTKNWAAKALPTGGVTTVMPLDATGIADDYGSSAFVEYGCGSKSSAAKEKTGSTPGP